MSFAIGGPTSKWAKTGSKSANYTILDTDELGVILVTTGSSANVTITLPTPSDNLDRIIEVVKVDSGTKFVEIAPDGAENIRGSNTSIYAIQEGESIRLLSDGTDWILLGDPYRTVSLTVSNPGSPSIARQSGTWVTNLNDNDTGDTQIIVATGVFLSSPTGTVSVATINGVFGVCLINSVTDMQVKTWTTAPAAGDYSFHLICHGEK